MAHAFLRCAKRSRKPWKYAASACPVSGDSKPLIFTAIEAWYNPHRRYSSLGQTSLINFDKGNAKKRSSEQMTPDHKNQQALWKTQSPQNPSRQLTAAEKSIGLKIPKRSRTSRLSVQSGPLQLQLWVRVNRPIKHGGNSPQPVLRR